MYRHVSAILPQSREVRQELKIRHIDVSQHLSMMRASMMRTCRKTMAYIIIGREPYYANTRHAAPMTLELFRRLLFSSVLPARRFASHHEIRSAKIKKLTLTYAIHVDLPTSERSGRTSTLRTKANSKANSARLNRFIGIKARFKRKLGEAERSFRSINMYFGMIRGIIPLASDDL